MGRIKLSDGGFTVIPEGTHVFKITKVDYNEDFGKLDITMETVDGLRHIERFRLLTSTGTENQGAINAFSYFAKNALGDFSRKDVDPAELVGRFLECDVEHDIQPSKNDPSKNVTFVRLTNKRMSGGWSEAPAEKPKAAKMDLASLLG